MSNILGVSIGTRNVGLAVIRKRKLIDHRIRTFAGKWTQNKCTAITDTMQQIIDRNSITQIVLKIPSPSHCSKNIQQLIDGIQETADRHRITVYRCTIKDLKCRYIEGKRSNKHEVIAALVSKYPELKCRCVKSKRTYLYHAKLFEAIACAELAQGAGH